MTTPANGSQGDDTRRLDWLEKEIYHKQRTVEIGFTMDNLVGIWLHEQEVGVRIFEKEDVSDARGDTVRQAIDVAMTAQRANGGKEP